MRYRLVVPLLVFMLLLQPLCAMAKSVRFAPLPVQSEDYTRREYYPFTKYLVNILQQPVEIAFQHNFEDVFDGLMSDEIDLALLCPLPFAFVSKKDPDIRPLLQFSNSDGSIGFTCSVGVFAAENLQITNLKNKQFSFIHPYSTCGFLMTEHLLNQQGRSLADNQFEYTGNRDSCVLRVIDGQADACGIRTSIAKQFHYLGLELIAESEVVPGFILVANHRTLNTTTIDTIREHLLALKPLENEQDADLTANWGELIRYGGTPVTVDAFEMFNDSLNRVDIAGGR